MAVAGRKPKGFTPTFIDNLPFEESGQKIYFDVTRKGFGVRVSSGVKSFIVQCVIKGRTTSSGRMLEIKKAIGRFGKSDADGFISLDSALNEYNRIIADAEQGITPAEREQLTIDTADAMRKEQARLILEEVSKDLTLSQLLEEYLLVRKTIKDSTAELYRNSFKWYFPEEWLNTIPARSITGDMVLKQHAEIGKRSHAMANSTMKALRAVYNYAIDAHDEVFLKNPVRKLSSLQAWYQIDRRENFIQAEDVNAWFDSVLVMENLTTRMLMLFLLFVGARKGEAVNLKWSNFNFRNNSVTIRETKSGKPLTVPVAKYVMGELSTYKEGFYTGEDGYVFASHGKTGHLVDVRRALRKVADDSGIKISPHDLRRGVLTYLKNVGVDVFTRKRLVNHAVADDITEGYTIHTLESLRLDVEKLADYIMRLAVVGPHIPQTILDERRTADELPPSSENRKVIPLRKAA
ncbi:MAG: tyrosine-type recombinase/integrase [Desulfuromonadaceae bacterium]